MIILFFFVIFALFSGLGYRPELAVVRSKILPAVLADRSHPGTPGARHSARLLLVESDLGHMSSGRSAIWCSCRGRCSRPRSRNKGRRS